MGHVGNHGHIEIHSRDPPLMQAVGGRLKHSDFAARVAHLRQVALHIGRVRRGDMQPGIQVVVADLGADGADHPGLQASRAQNVVDQVGGRGLAIGAGNADDPQRARRKPVQSGSQSRQRQTSVGNPNVGCGPASRLSRQVCRTNDRRGPTRQRIGNETVTIRCAALNRDEDRSGLHLPRVGGNRGDRNVWRRSAVDRVGKRGKQGMESCRHSSVPAGQVDRGVTII